MGIKRKVPPKPSQSQQEPPLKHQHQFNEYEEETLVEEQNQQLNDPTATAPSTSSPKNDDVDGDDDYVEPIQNLLEPLGKDEIAKLLCDAAAIHRDVADRIRKMADADPSHRKIFVHGLGWDATAETLTSAFREYGEIEDCKAVSDKVTGKSKGYGFILFKTRRGARNALRQPQKKIGNRITACQLASVGPVQPQQNGGNATAVTISSEFLQRKIYVSNVGPELDPNKLLMFFSRFGEIEEGPLGLDKATGKPKGFCLFVYKSVEGAKRALEEPHKKFEGHVLHCQRAIDGAKQQRMQGNSNPQRTAVPATGVQFQRNDNTGFVGGAAMATGHLMAPAGPGIGFSQGLGGVPAGQMVNPAIGQALTALLATPGAAGLQLNGLLGLGSQASGYGSQASVNAAAGGIGGYGSQVGLQAAYTNPQQVGLVGSGRLQQQQQQQQPQHGVGQFGGVASFLGH